MSRKSRKGEREYFMWEEVMEIRDGKNKKKKRKEKEQDKSLLNPLSGLNPSVITSY